MLAGYSDTAVQLIKMYFDAKMNQAKNQKSLVNDIGSKDEINDIMESQAQPPLTDEMFTQLIEMQRQCISNQTALQSASEALARTQLAAASARGGDATAYLYELSERIASLTVDIDYLSQILEKSSNPTLKNLTIPGRPDEHMSATPFHDVPTTASLVPQEEDASIWTEIRESLKKSAHYTSSMNAAHASHMDWSVNLFFGSASGSSSESSANSMNSHTATDTQIDIVFRAMKVVMNRPWFNPGIFKKTKDYYRNFQTPITVGSPDALRAAFGQSETVPSVSTDLIKSASKAILPSYSIAFVVVKVSLLDQFYNALLCSPVLIGRSHRTHGYVRL